MTLSLTADAPTPGPAIGQGLCDRLRGALVDDPDARFVLLGNFEVEEQWAQPGTGLPALRVASTRPIVHRMEEFGLFLAGPRDHVILKDRVDSDYAAHLRRAGLARCEPLYVDRNTPDRNVTEDALDSPRLLAALRRLADGHTYLLPLGVSTAEERLSAATGLPLAGPGAAVSRRVNSKLYSRELTRLLDLPLIPGQEVRSVADLRELDPKLTDSLAAGGRLVVKEAFGVSGKGLVVLDSPRRLHQLVAMLERRAARSGDGRLELVVEQWIDGKACDLNYQFTVAHDGTVTFDFVKEAITEGGVHKGHRMPARLTAGQVGQLHDTAAALGHRLWCHRYRGIVGVDAILGADGRLSPVLEINARFNMSTYQADVATRFVGPGSVAVARHYPLRLAEPLAFAELADVLGPHLFDVDRGTGFLVNNFATVNAGHQAAAGAGAGPVEGRLYALLIEHSDGALRQLEQAVDACLHEFGKAD